MYPIFRFAGVILKAKYREKLRFDGESVLNYRVSLSDTDMFMELNNARYLNYMELGRWDYSHRMGFLKLMRSKGWGVAVGGASIRYRRRIPLFNKFSVTTKLICHDGRWLYFLQEFHSKGAICTSALMKVCATSKRGLVPATEVIRELGEEMGADIPDWVKAWIDAEGLRPWPK
jgi:YbgC/YbaW family acyl-CoA thioester hydrolase